MPVHCRTGSLESEDANYFIGKLVHCRTGSLEKLRKFRAWSPYVHCRTGSLEIYLAAHTGVGPLASQAFKEPLEPGVVNLNLQACTGYGLILY